MKEQAKFTSKGQITGEMRRKQGAGAGDRWLFAEDGDSVRITAVRKASPFEKYPGIAGPGIRKGRKGLQKGRGNAG
jgi:bifunctional DNA-binding transcriptional regulator/antitoxin component of YhaV-PrlF toxin-antitoxin module